jgi:hypothetical protein
MRLHVRIDPSHARRWLIDLRARLQRDGHICDFVAGSVTPEPSAVRLLFQLESLIYRRRGPRPTDRVDRDTLRGGNTGNGSQTPDLVIDLAAAPAGCCETSRCLVVLFDGQASLPALLAPLLEGRMSTISVVDAATGAVIVEGVPGTDNAETVSEAMEFALARVVTLVAGAVARYPSCAPTSGGTIKARQSPAVSSPAAISFLLRAIAFSAVRRLYKLCYYAPHWRIGWRFIEKGAPGIYESLSLDGAQWNILPDPGVRFFADPFPISVDDRNYIFFEDLDHRAPKGVISYVEVDRSGSVSPVQRALEEPWHLSYPFLFKDDGQIWMIPESSANRTVDLYRAEAFPQRWTKVATLLSGIEMSDATLVRHNGRLWMFAATRDGQGSYSDTLSLFSAPKLTGPWTPHPANPVLVDQRAARPAGGFFVRDDRLWRPVQDCERGYGTGIGLAEVVRLNEAAFEQRVHTVLRTPAGWTGRRLHTLTRYGQLECIDGSAHSPKAPALFGVVDHTLRKRASLFGAQ